MHSKEKAAAMRIPIPQVELEAPTGAVPMFQYESIEVFDFLKN